jgi:hypothetical protein
MRHEKRVREALERQDALDLGTLLRDREQWMKASAIRCVTVRAGTPASCTGRARAWMRATAHATATTS